MVFLSQKKSSSGDFRPIIVILGVGGSLGFEYKLSIIKTANDLNVRIVILEALNYWATEELLSIETVEAVIGVDTSWSRPQQLDFIRETFRRMEVFPKAIVSYREEWIELRSLLCQSYDLPHQDVAAIRLSQNKGLARIAFEEAGLSNPHFLVCTLAELEFAKKNIDFPFFVKPLHGIRSEWARLINQQQDVVDYIASIASSSNKPEPLSFIVEEYLEGHEIDVDIYIEEGKLIYAGISDNYPTNLPFGLETGHLMPSILPKLIQENATEIAYKAVRACGYTDGVLHVEMMVKPNSEPVIIEVNGRLGGMYIAEWHRRIWVSVAASSKYRLGSKSNILLINVM